MGSGQRIRAIQGKIDSLTRFHGPGGSQIQLAPFRASPAFGLERRLSRNAIRSATISAAEVVLFAGLCGDDSAGRRAAMTASRSNMDCRPLSIGPGMRPSLIRRHRVTCENRPSWHTSRVVRRTGSAGPTPQSAPGMRSPLAPGFWRLPVRFWHRRSRRRLDQHRLAPLHQEFRVDVA